MNPVSAYILSSLDNLSPTSHAAKVMLAVLLPAPAFPLVVCALFTQNNGRKPVPMILVLAYLNLTELCSMQVSLLPRKWKSMHAARLSRFS